MIAMTSSRSTRFVCVLVWVIGLAGVSVAVPS